MLNFPICLSIQKEFNHLLQQYHLKNQMLFHRWLPKYITTSQTQLARRKIYSNGLTTMNVMEIRQLQYDKCLLYEINYEKLTKLVCRTSFQTSRIISSLSYLGNHMMAMKSITWKMTEIQLSSAIIPYTSTRSYESTTPHMISGDHKIQSTHKCTQISCFSHMITNLTLIGMHV